MNLIKKIYRFLQSRVGLIIVIALYFIWHFPLTTSSDIIQGKIGELIGTLASPFIIVLVLSEHFHWNRSQKTLHIFLLAFVFLYMMSNKSLSSIPSLISWGAIVVLIFTLIGKVFKKKGGGEEGTSQ